MLSIVLLPLLTLLAPEPSDRATVLVVVGAPGTEEYGKSFRAWTDRWRQAAERGGASSIVIGLDDDDSDDRGVLKSRLDEERQHAGAALWLVLIGHGTFDGKTARFNLRGPDVSAGELAGWLSGVQRPLAVIDCASASGPFINEVSAAGRVIITATKSGFEHNFARFGDHLSSAIADPKADLDKDDQTSLLEAFLLAAAGVKEYYEANGRLATEHALVDDNGDRLGTPADWFHGLRATKAAKDGAALDGLLANQFQLVASGGELRLSNESRHRRDELEAEMAALRRRKNDLPEADYYERLEKLAVEMAHVYEQQ
ncbi:MAG TPA: hypothetical protein VHC22_25905 [Pirellulales bacterium]|nr:hypothetical protein [Pirellulales bacterium]